MKIATATLVSTAPYSQSRSYAHEVPHLERETPDAYEERTWRNKAHTMPDGKIFIPPMAFKMALDAAASMLGMKIKGKGQKTYSKFFLSGVLVLEPLILPTTKDGAGRDHVYCNADGRRGSGKRVWRDFPRIDSWSGDVVFHVMADEITEEVFRLHLVQSGAFVGIGRFRPASGGYYGRFGVKRLAWAEATLAEAA